MNPQDSFVASNPLAVSFRLVGRLAFPIGVLLAGCSLPTGGGHQLTVGFARTSADAEQVQTTVPGLDVRLGTGHDGINLGW